jgi:hypothetical protein
MARIGLQWLWRLGLAWLCITAPTAWSVGGCRPPQAKSQVQGTPTNNSALPGEQEKERLQEGAWISVAPRDILGRGTDRIITLKRTGKQWQISFCSLSYTRFGESPKILQTGPYPLQSNAGILEIKEEQGVARQTFRFDSDRLVTPALVKTDALTWRMLWTWSTHPGNGKPGEMIYDKTVWRCLDDFRKQASGRAQFWTGRADQNPRPDQTPAGQEYMFKQEKDRSQREWSVLHFSAGLRADGTPREEAQLFWNAAGTTRIETSSFYGREVVYTPLPPADLEDLLKGKQPGRP